MYNWPANSTEQVANSNRSPLVVLGSTAKQPLSFSITGGCFGPNKSFTRPALDIVLATCKTSLNSDKEVEGQWERAGRTTPSNQSGTNEAWGSTARFPWMFLKIDFKNTPPDWGQVWATLPRRS